MYFKQNQYRLPAGKFPSWTIDALRNSRPGNCYRQSYT